MMTPEIKMIAEKNLVGKMIPMTFADDKTGELWRSFMPYRKQIRALTNDLISMRVFSQIPDFINFSPTISFDKWAAAEVFDFEGCPLI